MYMNKYRYKLVQSIGLNICLKLNILRYQICTRIIIIIYRKRIYLMCEYYVARK